MILDTNTPVWLFQDDIWKSASIIDVEDNKVKIKLTQEDLNNNLFSLDINSPSLELRNTEEYDDIF